MLFKKQVDQQEDGINIDSFTVSSRLVGICHCAQHPAPSAVCTDGNVVKKMSPGPGLLLLLLQ